MQARGIIYYRIYFMAITPKLDEMLIKAVQTSMRIEGYQPARTEQLKQRAKQLMEQKGVQVSVQSK
jgi:hypothetical protein